MSTMQDAARMVVHRTRQGIRPDHDHLVALLPVLDAVAAGQDGSRSEHWRGALWAAINAQNPFYASVLHIDRIADAAIALADTERAAAVAEGWRAYEEARDELERSIQVDQAYEMFESSAARITLDAAVRRLAGLDPAA